MSRRKEPTIPHELLNQLLAGGDASSAFDRDGLFDSLKKALTERALNAEMDHHLSRDAEAGNNRNGYGHKTVITDAGKIGIDVPRDRTGSFDPQLIAKYQRRFPGFDESAAANDLGDHWASHLDVCARYEHAGDHWASARTLCH
jgi:putative transposase